MCSGNITSQSQGKSVCKGCLRSHIHLQGSLSEVYSNSLRFWYCSVCGTAITLNRSLLTANTNLKTPLLDRASKFQRHFEWSCLSFSLLILSRSTDACLLYGGLHMDSSKRKLIRRRTWRFWGSAFGRWKRFELRFFLFIYIIEVKVKSSFLMSDIVFSLCLSRW